MENTDRKQEILAIIPARGGSKGLPGKNTRLLCGHPLLAYSILAAQKSNLITRIIVNTDDPAIAEIAKKYGAEVPFLRPAHLAEDQSTDLSVFQHEILWHRDVEGYTADLIIQLRPTSPLRQHGWIDDAIMKLTNAEADSLRVVTPAPITPYKMWQLNGTEQPMQPLLQIENIEEPYNMPRQILPQIYWQIGTLDVIKPDVILGGSMSGKRILPFVVDTAYAADIDDLNSFIETENKIQQLDCVRFDQ